MSDRKLNETAQALEAAQAELDDLEAQLASTQAEAEQARATLKTTLESVPASELIRAAARQSEAQRQAEAADLAAGELRRRIGRQTERVKAARVVWQTAAVKAAQAGIDELARVALAKLKAAHEALQATRAAEEQVIEQFSRTPNITYPRQFVDVIAHRIGRAEVELAEER
jgi:superfamily II RNA helicase